MPKSFDGRTARDLEAFEDALLAPYAVRSAGAARRYSVGDQGRTLAYRTAFQRDRDRILHSLAFRRLKHKTQVYVPYEGDHHRTRLTHTLEVAQVARTMARALGLNEDLAEAIALGHDLGQPPFGAGGEEVLADLLSGDDPVEGIDSEVLASSGGFRPNYQSLRVVDRLEQRYQHPGLNLTDPVREGIWKAGPRSDRIRYPDWEAEGLAASEPPFLEARVVGVADRIARLAHDLEDGIRAGEVSLEAAERLDVGRAVVAKLGDSYPLPGQRYKRQNALMRGIIHLLVSDVVVRTARQLQPWLQETGDLPADERSGRRQAAEEGNGQAAEEGNGQAAEEGAAAEPQEVGHAIARMPADTVDFSDTLRPMVEELEGFVESQVYRSFAVSRLDSRARTFIKGLFLAYYREPLQLDDYALYRYRAEAGGPYLRDVPGNRVDEEVRQRYRGKPAFVRLVADHIAGMSDTYALKEYERLYLPFPETEKR